MDPMIKFVACCYTVPPACLVAPLQPEKSRPHGEPQTWFCVELPQGTSEEPEHARGGLDAVEMRSFEHVE